MATRTDVELRTILQPERLPHLGAMHGNGSRLSPDATSNALDRDDSSRLSTNAPSHGGRFLQDEAPANAATSLPEGGYGWTIVSVCALFTFWFNGIMGSWGVVQAALLRSDLPSTSTSTISFVGTLGLACVVAFGLFSVRLVRILGARLAAFLGLGLLAAGEVVSSFTTSNVGGLFGSSGVLYGLGACLLYSISNILPTQYFGARLGLASGIVKLGGGIGAAVLAVAIDALIDRVGIPWTFRFLGLCSLATCAPAAFFIRERVPIGKVPFLDVSIFRNLAFTAIFFAGAIGTFSLFIPPYFLPLVAQSVGLSSSTGAGLVGGFNACTAVGRFLSGWLSDSIGPVNMFLLAMALNAISMLAIWPVSNSLGPLVIFAMFNGLANGAFFTLYPVVVASTAARVEHADSGRVAIAMGMSITGWTGGYLMGVPIAGYLLQASGMAVEPSSSTRHKSDTPIAPYRPAIFYAGGVALVSAGCVLVARLKLGPSIRKKV
ncbi:hypothetical protein G647_00916 [Cladophialophora carrionii CBS 160.54]|uniref:Major facilitator superfamily (MFS) profile domain-containing protein n=1 Tax=Cladophialophora carrionii CBS 160.54 TaxID=1279043 RepID=V9DR96_9EURO|nr:uncharacterized protein G647_00916 [Cladophialophora carrionii CBS 160.54]ETI28467.1 hypothetical protein G647_00916 [Cladophialophora carrionii CBS 160.54]